MNVNFEMAIQYINLEAYDSAIESLKAAIKEEADKGNEKCAIEFTCVLGELYGDLGNRIESEEEFKKVIEYCDRTGELPKQRKIAADFLDLYYGNIKIVTEPTPFGRANPSTIQTKRFVQNHRSKRRKN